MTDQPDIEALRRDLQATRTQLHAALTRVDEQLERLERTETVGAEAPAKPRGHTTGEPSTKRKPVRQVCLDVLEDFGTLLYSRQLSNITRAIYGRQISADRYGGLARDEAKSFESSRPRPVYLCHGLTLDRGLGIKRLWGRSDWPLKDRVFASTSGRAQHLRVTIRLCELAAERETTAADIKSLRILAADHAADLPGVEITRGEFHLEKWRDIARQVLADVAPDDERRRQTAAERLRALPAEHQLFGAPDQHLFLVAEPAAGGPQR